MGASIVKRKVLAAIIAVTAAGAAIAAEMKPEYLVKVRQSGYTFMAWNMGKIKAQTVENTAPFNKDEVAAAANAIAAIANSGMGALYAPGTEKATGWHETKALPELFTDKEGVKKVAMAFNKEANELAKVAAGGDAAAIKAQYGKVGEACKGCHDKFKAKEEKK
jgi:cytochrome c556